MGMPREFWGRGHPLHVRQQQGGIELELTFVNRAGPIRELGPLATMWLDGRVVRAERRGAVLATNYYSLVTDARVLVRFEGEDHAPSPCFGPFARFAVVDRMVYADGKAFALFNPRAGEWLCYDAGRMWPSMVVTA
jgi:hypothetical protein